jgi:hypothetical protein
VSCDEVDVICGVGLAVVTTRRSSARAAANDNHVAMTPRGLALNPVEPAANVKREVVAKTAR